MGPSAEPDPNGLGLAAGRWSSGGRKVAKVAVVVAGALLEEGEVVEAAVAGRVEGSGAVLVLTDRALVLASERRWRPHVERMALAPGLEVRGWQDDRTASLTLVEAGREVVVDQIGDRTLAVELAQRIRSRVGGPT